MEQAGRYPYSSFHRVGKKAGHSREVIDERHTQFLSLQIRSADRQWNRAEGSVFLDSEREVMMQDRGAPDLHEIRTF